ncbi:MAG: hypothetical protein AB7Q23_14285 [Hyphomonadaceae bacterium]
MAASERKYGYRASPQVSASQMAEYVSASATRRISIRRAARFPKRSVVAQYDGAREGLVKFLGDGSRSLSHLADADERLLRRAARVDASDWMKRDCKLSVEALEAFQRAYNKLGLRALDCRPPPSRQPALDMWPTKVTVTLDVTVHQHRKGEPDGIGGAILLFSKGEASSKKRIEQSKNVAGLILTYCDRFLSGMGTPDRNLCLAVDVFGGVAHKPPGSFSKGLRDVENSCDEIAALWKATSPPDDYDGPDPS